MPIFFLSSQHRSRKKCKYNKGGKKDRKLLVNKACFSVLYKKRRNKTYVRESLFTLNEVKMPVAKDFMPLLLHHNF